MRHKYRAREENYPTVVSISLDVTDLTDTSAWGDIRGLCPFVDKDADKPPVDPITIVGFNTATHKLP